MDLQNPESFTIYTDEALLAVNKPAGLLTLPDGYNPDLPYIAGLLEAVYGRLWTVHRLDRETSGILVFARSAEAHKALNTQFEHRKVLKTYHALVGGLPSWQVQQIELPLRINVGSRHRTVVDPQRGKPAVTNLEVMRRFPAHTLIAASPRTGYTHQIRAHLYAAGFPILFDPLYGEQDPQESRPPFARLALHAFSIAFSHPMTQQPVNLYAPYPEEFLQMLEWVK